jgi:hypothetical protein
MTNAQTAMLLGISLLFAAGVLSFVIAQMVRVGRVRQWGRFTTLGGIFVTWLAACALTTIVWLAMMVTHSHGPDEAVQYLLYTSAALFVLGMFLGVAIFALKPKQQKV